MKEMSDIDPEAAEERKRGPNKQRAAATRRALIEIAAREFAANGYAEVSIDGIVRAGSMTKGAFYHHFDSKLSILEAVVRSVQARLRRQVLRRTRSIADPWRALAVGCHAYLGAATADEGLHRLLFLDAPSALGWRRWREVDDRYWRADIRNAVASTLEGGHDDAEPMTMAISSALTHAILNIATAPDRKRAFAEAERMIDILLMGFEAYRLQGRRAQGGRCDGSSTVAAPG